MPWGQKRVDRVSHLRSSLRRGPVVFALREGVVGWGIPFWILMSLAEVFWWRNTDGLLTLLLLSLLFGALFGAMRWFTCTRELWKLEAEERLGNRSSAQVSGPA